MLTSSSNLSLPQTPSLLHSWSIPCGNVAPSLEHVKADKELQLNTNEDCYYWSESCPKTIPAEKSGLNIKKENKTEDMEKIIRFWHLPNVPQTLHHRCAKGREAFQLCLCSCLIPSHTADCRDLCSHLSALSAPKSLQKSALHNVKDWQTHVSGNPDTAEALFMWEQPHWEHARGNVSLSSRNQRINRARHQRSAERNESPHVIQNHSSHS